MRMGRVPWVAGLACLAGILSCLMGCARKHALAEPAPERKLTGITTLAFLPDPSNSGSRLPKDEEFLSPYPVETPAPIYPPKLLTTDCRGGVVYLRIIIGTDGHVGETRDSPLGRTTPGECGAVFRAAVEEAVHTWRFTPAQWRRLAPGDDYDEDGKPDFQRVVDSKLLAVYVDIRIEFSLVDGKPEVTIRQA